MGENKKWGKGKEKRREKGGKEKRGNLYANDDNILGVF